MQKEANYETSIECLKSITEDNGYSHPLKNVPLAFKGKAQNIDRNMKVN